MIGNMNAKIKETTERYADSLEVREDPEATGIRVVTSSYFSRPQAMLSILKSDGGDFHVIVPKWIYDEYDRDMVMINSILNKVDWDKWNDWFRLSQSLTTTLQKLIDQSIQK